MSEFKHFCSANCRLFSHEYNRIISINQKQLFFSIIFFFLLIEIKKKKLKKFFCFRFFLMLFFCFAHSIISFAVIQQHSLLSIPRKANSKEKKKEKKKRKQWKHCEENKSRKKIKPNKQASSNFHCSLYTEQHITYTANHQQ